MATLVTAAVGALKTAGLGTALMAGGSIVSGIGAIQSGNAENAAAQYNAAEQEKAGKAEFASATLQAEEENRQKEITLSRARAVGAAGGGGLDFEMMGDIEEDGTYRTLTAAWEGQEAMAGRNAQAAATRFEGKQAKRAGLVRGVGTILSGGGLTLFEKYG